MSQYGLRCSLKKRQTQGYCPLVFSRAVAFACFTAMKWLMAVVAVLFAALAATVYLEGAVGNLVLQYLVFAASALAISALMHWLARRILLK